MLKKFISYYSPYKKLFFLDLFVASIASVCDLIYPILTRNIINEIIPKKEIKLFSYFALGLLIIYFIKMFCGYFMQYYGHVIGVRMQGDMRKEIYSHLQNLPIRYFDNNQTGKIMSKIVNDLMDISELAHHGPEDLFISLIMILGSFFLLLNINVHLTLIIFLVLPILIWFAVTQRKKMLDAFIETREKTSLINANLQNSISGIRVSKVFGIKQQELEKFEKSNMEFKKAREHAYKIMAEYVAGVGFFTDMLDYIVLIFGSFFVYKNIINIGDLIAYFLYVKAFTQPLKRLIGFIEQYQSGMSGFKRYFELINEQPEKNPINSIVLSNIRGDILFKNVDFSYENESIFKNLNLHIEPGKTTALVGVSGGGKTTICNLISKFYTINKGDILIDGYNINSLNITKLRDSIGIVQQDVFLFSGTIKENILIGKPNATSEELILASKRANIHDFIESLPDGYNSQVGERGIKLSGGQKQRISIARIFLKNPSILILDEATSALDTITEKLIQESLISLAKGRTTIIVAHRLSTIKHAHQIIFLGSHGIEESGTHEELLQLKGKYAKYYYNNI